MIILGSSGFVGQSLNDFLKKKKSYKIFNYSRTQKKNIIDASKLPGSDFIIYCINNKNIKISLKYFFHFKNYYIKTKKNQKYYFLVQEQCMGLDHQKKNSKKMIILT